MEEHTSFERHTVQKEICPKLYLYAMNVCSVSRPRAQDLAITHHSLSLSPVVLSNSSFAHLQEDVPCTNVLANKRPQQEMQMTQMGRWCIKCHFRRMVL